MDQLIVTQLFGIVKYLIVGAPLAVAIYFIKKADVKLDAVVTSVIDLNLTMTKYVEKHDTIAREFQAFKAEHREYKRNTNDEIKHLREFKHKHLHDAENLIRMYSDTEVKINKLTEEIIELKAK